LPSPPSRALAGGVPSPRRCPCSLLSQPPAWMPCVPLCLNAGARRRDGRPDEKAALVRRDRDYAVLHLFLGGKEAMPSLNTCGAKVRRPPADRARGTTEYRSEENHD